MESEVIIFDEPTAALDPLNAAMLEEVLQKMGDEGRTMLISTHDVDFAYRWAERVIVFCHGKIIADDTPLAVFKQEDILKQANLKHPMMFDVYDILKEKGIVPDGDVYPKNIAEFQAMVKGLKNRILGISWFQKYTKIKRRKDKCLKNRKILRFLQAYF